MKRILLFLAFAVAAFAQPQPFAVWFTNPTGQACQGGQGAIYAITGGLYTCQSNVFATASVATGGLAPFTTDGTNVTLPSGTFSVGQALPTGAPSGTTGSVVFYSPKSAVNLAAYGAVGNGSADDTSKIQAALNSFGGYGGIVLGAIGGDYKITSTITLKAGVVLDCQHGARREGPMVQLLD